LAFYSFFCLCKVNKFLTKSDEKASTGIVQLAVLRNARFSIFFVEDYEFELSLRYVKISAAETLTS
jgi:hypothetical protein